MKLLYSIALSFLFLNANSQTFNGTGGFVPDDQQNHDLIINVSGLSSTTLNASLGVIQVCLDITHTYNADLNVHLISPDGIEINLFSGIGGGDDNFTNTCLNQSAPSSINTASSPFTGTFQPQESLGNLNNSTNGNGNWILRILDTYPADNGTLNSWSIEFGGGASVPVVFSESRLPIVLINTNNVSIPDEPKIDATMGIIFNGFGNVNHMTDPVNHYSGNIGIEMRGAYSQSLPQKPYAIETRDALNAELDTAILGMPSEHDWILLANYNDKVFMRNKLPYDLFEDMGHYSARSQYCEVVINGNYSGIYLFMEKPKRDKNRISISKLDTNENTGIDLTGGYIIKNDYWDGSNSWLSSFHPIDHPTFDVHLVYEYPQPDVITVQQKTYLQSFIYDFENTLYGANYADTINGYRKYLSITSWLDYLILNELARNNDGFKKSSIFHKDRDKTTGMSKLKAGPVWDFDWAWKNINECSIFSATDGSGWAHHINDCNPDVNSPGWYVRLMQDTLFQNDFRCRWEYLRGTILNDANLSNYIDSVALYLDSAQMRHFEKWGNLGVNTGTPEMEQDPATYAGQITKFKDWLDLRIAWLDANIPGNANGCDGTFATILENDLMEVLIFPNPASNYLYIESDKIIDEITLMEINGKEIFSNKYQAGIVQLDITEIPSGIYFCSILSTDGKTKIEKVVIHH